MDAAFNVASKIASLGVVSKNDEALIDFTTLTKVPGVESPLHAESLTIQFSLQMASEMNYKEIQLESDHWIVVTEISKGKESFCIWDSIFAYILDLFHCFESCSISYINRTANELAHNLAKVHCELNDSIVGFGGEHYLFHFVIMKFYLHNEVAFKIKKIIN